MRRFPIFRSFILLLNLLAALLLAMSQLATFIPPSQFAVFSVLSLIYPVLLGINLAFIAFWSVFKSRYWLISSVIILIGINNLFNNFQFHFKQEDKKGDKNIKIITYNVMLFSTDKTGKDSMYQKNNIISFLTSEQAQIICLQEYHSMDRYVYLPLIELSKRLGQNTYYYESYFMPRYDQLSGLVIFSQYEAVNKGKLKFPGSRTFGIFTDLLIDKDTIRVYNIHLASIRLQESDIGFVLNPDFNDRKEFRIHSATIYTKLVKAFLLRERQLDYVLQEISNCRFPVILCGDFNDTPSSYIYNRLSAHLTDTFIKKGNKLSRTYAGHLPYLRIDYIFASDDFSVQQYKRELYRYSDHFPVSSILLKK